MSDCERWRYGDTNSVIVNVAADITVEIGDLLYFENNAVWPASHRQDQDSEVANQAMFSKNFLGVAMQRSSKGKNVPIRAATTGVFEFDCPAFYFRLGDLIGVMSHSDQMRLHSQRVTGVSAACRAIARVAAARKEGGLLIAIRSSIMTNGIRNRRV